MMLFLTFRASWCDHNLPTHPGCLDSLTYPVVPAHWDVQCPQTLFVLHPWLTHHAVTPIWSDIFFSAPHFQFLPSCSASAPQREVTFTSLESVSSSIPLFLKEAFLLYPTPVAISTSPRSWGSLYLSQQPAQCLATDASEIFVGWRNQEVD